MAKQKNRRLEILNNKENLKTIFLFEVDHNDITNSDKDSDLAEDVNPPKNSSEKKNNDDQELYQGECSFPF